MRGLLGALGLALALLPTAGAEAHPLAPGLLELTEIGPARYAVLWRTSVARAGSAGVEPRLPADCRSLAAPESRIEKGEALVARWVAQCAEPLAGRALAVEGLEGSGINVIVRMSLRDAAEFNALLGADQPAVTVNPAAAEPVFGRYLQLGLAHLPAGLDHVLFLCGLFLLVGAGPEGRASRLVVAVTAFTAGHSVTLTLAVLGLLPFNQAAAELMIAATVLALALALVPAATKRGQVYFSAARRPENTLGPFSGAVLAGGFGLVHGLGFAGALREAGLPAEDVPLSLLAFNLGIELAQLGLVAVLMLLAWAWRRMPAVPRLAPALPAYVIGSMATCWVLERSATLLA